MEAKINLHHGDCMKAMVDMPDNAYDLAIVDPPYGIGEDGRKKTRTKPSRPNSYLGKPKYKIKAWDNSPPCKYFFIDLLRVCRQVIIFGANHFIEKIPNANSSCWIVWDKNNIGTDFADCELAWSNMTTTVRKYKTHKFTGTRGGKDCIHPTQKPVKLYKWLLTNYAKPGDKILDTHGGSMSIAVACHDLGFDLDLWELDEDYYKAGVKRYRQHAAQLQFF